MKFFRIVCFVLGFGLIPALFFPAVPGAQERNAVAGLNGTAHGPVKHIASPFPQPPPPSTRVRVVVIDVSGTMARAHNVAMLLTRFRRRVLEEKIGMKLELANLSSNRRRPRRGNVLYYRPGFLRAAMLIAKAIPGEQSVLPMPEAFLKKAGVDVEVHLGEVPR